MSSAVAGRAGLARLSRAPAVAYAPAMDPGVDDSALMLRYRDGDVAAFEALYRRHKDPLYRYLLRVSAHPDAAEDVFQEVWRKIVQSRGNYRATAKFTTFLYHVAHNCFIDYLRRDSRHAHLSQVDPDLQADQGPEPDVIAERSLARRRLEAALAELPLEQRDAFLLHEEAGLSLEQIAEVTGANRETAKSRLRYAVRKLRTAIAGPAPCRVESG